MDYEKAYRKALEKAKDNYNAADNANINVNSFKNTLIAIFPELKESENELTWLTKFIEEEIHSLSMDIRDNEDNIKLKNLQKSLAWLEKQGHQEEPQVCEADNGEAITYSKTDGYNVVDSKFKVGDILKHNNSNVIVEVLTVNVGFYCLRNILGGDTMELSNVEKNFHLWTIADAKDGDVLVNGSNIFIFHFINDTRLMGYCHVNTDDGRFYDDIDKTECFCLIDAVVNPATKEQHDLLFTTMKEAGYQWDGKKKKLNKIEQKDFAPEDKCAGCNNIRGCMACVDGDNWAHYHYEDEQNPIDKSEPKIKVGDWIVTDRNDIVQIKAFNNSYYTIDNGTYFYIRYVDNYCHLWTIKDAKDGDVVVDKSDGTIGIFQSIGHHPDGGSCNDPSYCFLHCRYDDGYFFDDFENGNIMNSDDVIPATKEQCDLLFQKMEKAGYQWDGEKKKLKKIEETINGEDYGIDGLWHAINILEETLGNVDGYQSDDGILEHKAAITAVKKLYEQKHAWSDEDEENLNKVIGVIERREMTSQVEQYKDILHKYICWLKSLKDRVQPQPKEQ